MAAQLIASAASTCPIQNVPVRSIFSPMTTVTVTAIHTAGPARRCTRTRQTSATRATWVATPTVTASSHCLKKNGVVTVRYP